MIWLIANWQRLALYAAVVLAVVSAIWLHGRGSGLKKLYEYQAEQAKEGARIVVKRGEVTTRVVTEYVKVAGKTQTVTNTVEKEVVRYAVSNPGLQLDLAWRWLHDAAARNGLPDPAPRLDAEGGAPTAAQALETVTANYAACHRTADRLDSLQDWVRQQGKVR